MGEHGTNRWRRRIIAAGMVFLVLGVYRVFNPVPGMYTIITLVLLTTTLLFLLRTHTTSDAIQHLRDSRRRLEPYDTLSAVLTTGVMLLLFMYLVTYALVVAAYTVRRIDIIDRFLFESIQHLRLIESFHPVVFAALYVAATTIVAIGVFIIYPHIPIKRSLPATITAFLASWVYTLTLSILLLPFIHPLTLESLVLDAAIIVIWAYLFDKMYGKPLIPNPFLRRLGRKQD
jgi:hypothetical protein